MAPAFSIWAVAIPLLILAAAFVLFWFLRRIHAGWFWQIVGIVILTLGFGVSGIVTSQHWLPIVRPYFQCGCSRNMDMISKMCSIWSMDHCPNFPSNWSDLCFFETSLDCLKCPHGSGRLGPTNLVDTWAEYVLVTNMTTGHRHDCVLAYCKPGNHRRGTYVLFVDGSHDWVDADDFDVLGCDIATNSRTCYGRNSIECKRHLTAIGDASRKYAKAHNNMLPQRWASLTNYVDDASVFRCPSHYRLDGLRVKLDVLDAWADLMDGDYILVTNLCVASPPDTVFIYCKPGTHDGGTCVLFTDGHVRFVKTNDFCRLGCDVANKSRVVTGRATIPPK